MCVCVCFKDRSHSRRQTMFDFTSQPDEQVIITWLLGVTTVFLGVRGAASVAAA